ncbi:Z1 domain-containing protein [Arenibacter sp. BSSL-BM3]|uniref:Z1 domain-containing protein n=1 Tax=Arenibacter arenosicollis TaxID=2762274 RepID=A0ABR7QTD1_9FLAO|nr:Z1 domain-containing protein [Arenibacter arenosicollis]MBC8770436.1 Z1 domain-containing protein [Arenibacter arenosicollis]
MNEVAERILQILIGRFRNNPDNFNLESELGLKDPITEVSLNDNQKEIVKARLLDAIRYKESHDGATLVPISLISDPRLHEEWYDQWLESNNDDVGSYYWKRLEEYLSTELSRKYGPESAGKVVRSIDEATKGIMSKLADPGREEFSYKGLVVGYVQSGKTANFTALIAKAVDSGYKFIVVLSGIHSVLRRQTQIRLDKELTGMNDLNLDQSFIDEPSDAKRWNRITTARLRRSASRTGQIKLKDLGEFDTVNVDPFDSYCRRSSPTIAIIKKNVSVLTKLLDYILQSSEESRKEMPLLIIDDEADQASVDGNANDPDSDPTRTNEKIRELLSLFSRKAYVGYTATPFANALIDMNTEHEMLEDDLYPRNFIVSLTEPEGYFGTRLIFQSDLSECFVNPIDNEGLELIQTNEMTHFLSVSIDEFLIACAIRNLRGDRVKPMSMLVHISHLTAIHNALQRIITDYVEIVKGRYNNLRTAQDLKNQYNEVYNTYNTDCQKIRNELDVELVVPSFEEIWSELRSVLDAVQVLELNSSSDDRLNYSEEGELKVIAIGGNQLSRGLTLEGLLISYYLRDSRQYDTLLQMGRWFGYRMGYEDLTRVHTTETIWESFEHLALVEDELRSEIFRYEEETDPPVTPADLAVAIRAHRRLNVTARNKMGAARLRQSSYSNSLNQTHWLPLDNPDRLRSNYNLGESFINGLNGTVGFTNVDNSGVYLLNSKIDGERVLTEFLTRYSFISKEETGGPGLDSRNLLEYIYRRLDDGELANWSIAVVGNANPRGHNNTINYGSLEINPIQRSRKFTDRGYNIGVLTEPNHITIDLDESEERQPSNPLLLLYLIWKDSTATVQHEDPVYGQRVNLYYGVDSDKVDVLGIAVILPRSRYEHDSYIGQ